MCLPAAEIQARIRAAGRAWALALVALALWAAWAGDPGGLAQLHSDWARAHRQALRVFTDWALYPAYVFFPALILWGGLRRDRALRLVGWSWVLAELAGAALTVRILKILTGHGRPNAGDAAGGWFGPSLDSALNSMPSGHSADIFTSAVLLCLLLPRPWMRLAAMFWALAVALSRVALGKHWPMDVVAGAAVGGLWALIVAESWLAPRLRRLECASAGPVAAGAAQAPAAARPKGSG